MCRVVATAEQLNCRSALFLLENHRRREATRARRQVNGTRAFTEAVKMPVDPCGGAPLRPDTPNCSENMAKARGSLSWPGSLQKPSLQAWLSGRQISCDLFLAARSRIGSLQKTDDLFFRKLLLRVQSLGFEIGLEFKYYSNSGERRVRILN